MAVGFGSPLAITVAIELAPEAYIAPEDRVAVSLKIAPEANIAPEARIVV